MDQQRMQEALEEISRQVAELRSMIDQATQAAAAAAEAPPAPDPSPPSPSPDPPMPDPQPTPPPPLPEPPVVPEPSPPPIPEPTPPVEVPPAVATNGHSDDGAARLVAMKLAIEGGSREAIESALAEKFGAADRTELLNEVLSRVGR